MVRSVLIPVDGSDNSKRALKYYIDEIRKADDALFLLHVHVPPTLPCFNMHKPLELPVEEWQKIIREQMESSQNVIKYYNDLCAKSKIKEKTLLMAGKPGETICAAITEHKINLVVIGSRGLNNIRLTVMGSVSDYVLHHSSLPVVIVPPQ